MARPTLFLIDGSSQMYRAYHAFRGRGLSDLQGHTTHAVYVFVTMLRKLINDHHPQYLAASFDLAGPTFRDEISADYKATRRAMPDDLVEQINWVHEACEAMGVPILTAAGYEADDVIGTVAIKAASDGFQVAIVSIDKDFFQLVHDGIRVYDPREDGAWFDEAGVIEKFGVKPSQVADVLALVGDTSDNVAGVPGVGKKGATDLIAQYGTLDTLLDKAGELKPKYREALTAHRTDALQSRELVTIRTDVPVEVEFESLRYRGGSRERCYELFTRLDFRSLKNEYAPTADSIQKDYKLVQTVEELDALVAELRAAGEFALRVIPDQPLAMRSDIVGLAFATADRRARYLPLGHTAPDAGTDLLAAASAPPPVARELAFERLTPLLADEGIRKVGHDLKFDMVVLARHGIALRGLAFDSMLASYLLDATRPGHPLEETSLEHLGYKALNEEDLCGRGAKALPFARLAPDVVLNFAGERADLARQLSNRLAPLLVTDQLEPVYRDLEMPLIPVLAAIERAGVRIDGPALAAQSQHIERELATYTRRIYELSGQEFNVNSPKQLGEILFDKLKLPALKKTGKTRSASTAVEVLEELALTHELPRLILEWRALHKLKSTYIDALPVLIHPDTGRVHTCFNQAVAATGRLSSSDPNLQNIPIRTELGREIRRAFVADPGHVLISADYSQIELRVLAHMSGDETLIEAFRTGADIHDRTAMKVFGPNSGLGKHELRRRAKIVNYALLYGKTAFTLAKDINVTKDAAQEFIDAYFAGFPRVRAFIDRILEQGRETGVVKTLFGRRRLVPNLTSRNFQIRAQAERETVNMPIQGTAADILKLAMIDLHRELPARGLQARMILTVHDELLFECSAAEAEVAAETIRERMQAAAALAVPLTVDIGIAENWRDAKG
ncbi:MAG TPA: DNA polymerase I [Vicinamibacterales bacterium]|jgi:DNA polymerase-1|nr:DNA polymerase I [Vicinamibacterales bacterium]